MESTLVVDMIMIGTLISGYFYMTQHKRHSDDSLHVVCKNMSELLQFFQKNRRNDDIDPIKFCEELKILKTEPTKLLMSLHLIERSNIFSILESHTNNDDRYLMIRDNLIQDIMRFLETLSEYNLSIIPHVTSHTTTGIRTHLFSPNQLITEQSYTICDQNNRIHFCVIDALCRNIEYVDLIKYIYEKYFGYEKEKITEILIAHTHQDALEIIVDYSNIGEYQLQIFDHIINNHTNTWTRGTNYMATSEALYRYRATLT